MKLPGSGPLPANSRIMVVGETFGENEEERGVPFVGKSGHLLDSMLASVGIGRDACYVTNVVNRRPPLLNGRPNLEAWWTDKAAAAKRFGLTHRHGDHWMHEYVVEGLAALPAEIERARPEVVVALGNLALWALTGETGIGNWRGSEMWFTGVPVPAPWDWAFKKVKGEPGQVISTARTGVGREMLAVVPTYHPAYVLRVWEWKAPVTHDLRKRVVGKMGRPELRQEPLYNFTVPTTSYEQADERLARLCDYAVGAEDLACDIETRRGRIVCVGLGWSRLDGLCVPFMHVDGSRFWTPEQEAGLSSRLRTLLCGATDYSIGNQNWNYDRQYFIADPAFGFRPRMEFDTMIAQHLLLPGTEKSLAYLSSMYCQHHRFWKEDGKEVVDQFDEDRFFNYNCVDAVKTWEVWQQQKRLLRARGLL